MAEKTEADLLDRIGRSRALAVWIGPEMEGVPVPDGLRASLVAASFDLAFEHHRSIVELISLSLYGSAYALMRSLFETGTAGLWLEHCPDDAYIEAIAAKRRTPQMKSMLPALADHPSFKAAPLRDLMLQGTGKIFQDFTHGGWEQLSRRVPNRRDATRYSRSELIGTLFIADAMVLTAVEYAHAFYQLPALGKRATALLDAMILEKERL